MSKSEQITCKLRCEYLKNPLGVEETKPRLSWQIADERKGACQTAYQIVAASSPEGLEYKPDLWDSGKIRTDKCLDIVYAGKELNSRRRIFWRVRVWDHKGEVSEWSEVAWFEMGLLKLSDWKAKWIGKSIKKTDNSQPCPFLRRTFVLKPGIKKARIYVTSRGLFELHLNGERVGKDYFTPGWTDYKKRIQYIVYDVTTQLSEGNNVLGAILGDGWYAGFLGWGNNHHSYGYQLSLLMQLEVEYFDGKREIICSDPDWKTALGPILKSDIYNGETYDARREIKNWDSTRGKESVWKKVTVFSAPKASLEAKCNAPVRKQESLPSLVQTEPVKGTHIFDLGQNMVGWAKIRFNAKAGTAVKIRYGEMLNDDGTLYTANLRAAECTDRYICKGGGKELFEPHFTFHGFRYVELTGLSKKPAKKDVTGIVLHSELPGTGKFECSDKMINRLQKNIIWGQKGNFLDVPTDCPQRDERMGWTGDAQVFIRTACFNRDVASFFTKWCVDLSDAQNPEGAFSHVAPDVIGGHGSAAWADAGVICPWTIYKCYGDTRILERQYDSMKRWIDWMKKKSVNHIITPEACFGDWLGLDFYEGRTTKALTPHEIIATAYYAYSTAIFAGIAKILGKNSDAKKYSALVRKIKSAFNREFVSSRGRVMSETQTSYLLALGFDLLPKTKQPYALSRLIKEIEKRNCHLATGFVGTPLLNPVLTKFGKTDIAYKLLLQKTYPSWLYSILQGATTMWERWNSYTRDNGFGDVGMNSFNHYAYGAIGEWMYNTVAGIELDPENPGYKHIIIRPQPQSNSSGMEKRINWVKCELMTRYGKVSSSWKIKKGKFYAFVIIPANTTATVILPGQKPRKVGAGNWEFVGRI
ncbi:MAG: hypothetical protein A2452_01540 [Candidatus Firestonebacteria bacterium RIFOXYC2_FULL_39_67]|nr:MAG: hypothetical protein A2536_05795 [Candidatus Firestonebacteria bacterium RIFOXYD2_FULL_39_29]OGF54195.1 MAG: hypothetical protein A2452_01540 [Candidatus Firestonebacteria bacterium RIFOXYC2_FULL_39_67]